MSTPIYQIKNPQAEQKRLEEAARILRQGGLVVFPTETVYGLGGDATNAEAAEKIYAAKGRPSDNPLIVHIADPSDAEKYAFVPPLYRDLAKAFMPGPLTVILPKKDIIPRQTTGGLDTIAVRCPSHPVAHALIQVFGRPIAAPSANLSGKPSPTRIEDVREDMDGRVDLMLDGGPCEIGLESTIVQLREDGSAVLLRPGAVTRDALLCVLPRVEIAPAVTGELEPGQVALSPGMKYRHYAPSSPFVLLDGPEEDILSFLRREQQKGCAVLCYDEEIAELESIRLFPVGPKADLAEQARRLFTRRREADHSGAPVIYGHLPVMDGLGLALYNRMIRAAAHTVRTLP